MKVAIVGTHGSGKSVIAFDLVSRLKKIGKNVNIVPEIARASPFLVLGERTPESQLDLFTQQISQELRSGKGYDILVSDRSVLDILMYTELFFPDCSFIGGLREISKDYAKTYDFMFRTSVLYDPTETNDRIRPKEKDLQMRAHHNITKLLSEFYPNYIALPEDSQKDPVDFILANLRDRI